jgi:lysyl-tRNA synthetase, class II
VSTQTSQTDVPAAPCSVGEASNAPKLIALATAIFAGLSLAAATTPSWGGLIAGLQSGLIPDAAARGAVRGVVVSVSIGLLLLARGLARRQRRAWLAAAVLTAAAAALYVLRDADVPSTLIATLLLLALWHWRAEFYAAASVRRPVRTIAVASLALALIFGFGAAEVLRHATSQPSGLHLTAAASRVGWGMIGQNTVPSASDFSRNLVATLTTSSVLVLAALAWALLQPPKGGSTSSTREWLEARRIVAASGADSLAYFSLRRDKRYFFDPQHTAFVAYRAVAGIALVSGDPIGNPAAIPWLLEHFRSYCRTQAWRMAVIGVGADMRTSWQAVGLKTLYVGDEAVVRTSSFSLEGRDVRKLRQSVNRLERLGYQAEIRRADELDAVTAAAIAEVSRVWRDGQPERGFSMALEETQRPELGDTLFVLGRDAQGRLAGCLHLVPVPATGDLSLSAMRRLPGTPNGFNEFLVSSLLAWAHERGIERVSLNFAVLGSLLRDEGSGPRARAARGALRQADRYFQMERLLNFNRKFRPQWVPRYLAVESRADVPATALVLLYLEKLLPLPRRAGGRWWRPATQAAGPGEPLFSEAPATAEDRHPGGKPESHDVFVPRETIGE